MHYAVFPFAAGAKPAYSTTFGLLRACIQQYKHAYMVIYFMKYSIFLLKYAPQNSIIMHA